MVGAIWLGTISLQKPYRHEPYGYDMVFQLLDPAVKGALSYTEEVSGKDRTAGVDLAKLSRATFSCSRYSTARESAKNRFFCTIPVT
jgi:hypothetical protein